MSGMVLNSTGEVIEILGGFNSVGALTKAKYGVVWNWKRINKFPYRTFPDINDALARLGHVAPRRLWSGDDE